MKTETEALNSRYISSVLNPISRHVDYDEEEFPNLNRNDEASMRNTIIRPLIVPFFLTWDDNSQHRLKDSLNYLLNVSHESAKSRYILEDIFYDLNASFQPPDDIRFFFVWLWHELFQNTGRPD